MVNVLKFARDYGFLLGIYVLGYLGYHAVRWIINKCSASEKIDHVAQKVVGFTSPQRISLSSNHNANPHILPQMAISRQSEEIQMNEIALQQQSEGQEILYPNNLGPRELSRDPKTDSSGIAATKIQCVFRGHLTRLALKQTPAAIKIQSIWRGHSARIKAEKERRHVLSYALLEQAKGYINNSSNLGDVPRASSGKTPVFLPKELPIVLKQSGSPGNQFRFAKMRQARDICEKSGYPHLVIPKARVWGNFIVESRLPISVHGTKEQIGLYIENRDRFTGAVKEFTGFLCQSTLYDIVGGNCDPYGTLSTTPVGRYDNVALYLEGGQGKIGLIDLEQFDPAPPRGSCFFACRDAVNLFPHHLEDIIGAAKEFDSNIEAGRKDLEQERDGSLKRFKLAYEDHVDFIKEKGITVEDPLKIAQIAPVRQERIKETMVELIRNESNGAWYKNCLGENSEETIRSFEKSFPQILDLMVAFLSERLKERRNDAEEPISSFRQLVSCRTLCFSDRDKRYLDLRGKVSAKLQMMKLNSEWKEEGFASLIIERVFEELAKGREIAYYNSSFGYGGYAKWCIFC